MGLDRHLHVVPGWETGSWQAHPHSYRGYNRYKSKSGQSDREKKPKFYMVGLTTPPTPPLAAETIPRELHRCSSCH